MHNFELAVNMYCKGLDTVNIGCHGDQCEYADGDENHQCEASFSFGQCDSCGSTLGGDRHKAQGCWTITDEGVRVGFESIDMDVCTDCAMYHANGQIPETW